MCGMCCPAWCVYNKECIASYVADLDQRFSYFGCIGFVSLLFPLICPCKVINVVANNMCDVL